MIPAAIRHADRGNVARGARSRIPWGFSVPAGIRERTGIHVESVCKRTVASADVKRTGMGATYAVSSANVAAR